jgi:hypothetical protein
MIYSRAKGGRSQLSSATPILCHESHQDRLNYGLVVILLIEFFMNNIQELVIDKVKALSLNQQKSVLYFIDRILSPNVINSDQ